MKHIKWPTRTELAHPAHGNAIRTNATALIARTPHPTERFFNERLPMPTSISPIAYTKTGSPTRSRSALFALLTLNCRCSADDEPDTELIDLFDDGNLTEITDNI